MLGIKLRRFSCKQICRAEKGLADSDRLPLTSQESQSNDVFPRCSSDAQPKEVIDECPGPAVHDPQNRLVQLYHEAR